jgi:hypothetical protein
MPPPTRAQLDQQYDRYGQPLVEAPWSPEEIMNNDVDADGHGISDLRGVNFHEDAAADAGCAKTVWITMRTDDVDGSGISEFDGRDGSTQAKFDAIVRAYYLAGTTHILFELGEAPAAAPFKFIGGWDAGAGSSWLMLTGWKFRGRGKTKTYVQQVVGSFGQILGVGSTGDGSNPLFSAGELHNQDNQEVSGMTIECGWFLKGPGGDNTRPYGNFSAVFLYGENSKIDVDASGMGWSEDENFGCWIGGGHNGAASAA